MRDDSFSPTPEEMGWLWWVLVLHGLWFAYVYLFWEDVKRRARPLVSTREGLHRWGRIRRFLQPWLTWLGLARWNAHHIRDNILLGDLASACDRRRLKEHGVTHVVTAIIGVDEIFPNDFEYHLIAVCDVPHENLVPHLDNATLFIHEAVSSGGKVFVHCMAGVSRSATVLAAYLIRFHGLSPDEAIALLIERRPIVNPNPGFRKQLEDYHRVHASAATSSN